VRAKPNFTCPAGTRLCGHAAGDGKDARYDLAGIHLDPDAAVATDGHRLAFKQLGGLPLPAAGIIVPWPTCERLRVLLKGADGEVAVTASERSLTVAAAGWVLNVLPLFAGTLFLRFLCVRLVRRIERAASRAGTALANRVRLRSRVAALACL
jgi:hypothetical protein